MVTCSSPPTRLPWPFVNKGDEGERVQTDQHRSSGVFWSGNCPFLGVLQLWDSPTSQSPEGWSPLSTARISYFESLLFTCTFCASDPECLDQPDVPWMSLAGVTCHAPRPKVFYSRPLSSYKVQLIRKERGTSSIPSHDCP